MTIKSLLFILFLCLCLIWAVAVYQYSGPEIVNHGLLWTILLLSAVLLLVIGSRLWAWWRVWRAKGEQRPVAPTKPAATVHEDDAALAALIAEANATLAKAPGYTASTGTSPLSRLPLYLLIGPESSGKTATFLNCGVEPQMLAGQPGTPPTRLCNLWLAKNAVFAELSGRAFGGDAERWNALLKVLRGTPVLSFWQRLWREPEEGLRVRGVVGFCDIRELTGAGADPQRFERGCRDWQDRLRAIGQVFGADFPVYQVFTKCDKIPFFPEYFGRLPESEVNQILGCTLPFRRSDASPVEAFTDLEAKRLTGAFRPLYQSLAERRLSHLAHEPNPARKPAIYEFPRELKKVRQPLVQFLMDVFRPNQLQSAPVLRGFYLTGVQEVEAAIAKTTPEDGDWTSPNLSMEATRLFRGGDATQMFRQDNTEHAGAARARVATRTRWIFASDLFHQIVLADRPPLPTSAPQDPKLERYRRGVVGATCSASILLCLAFVTSWANNRSLLNTVAEAGGAVARKKASLASLGDLRSLDNLREQVERLQNGAGLSYRWGLYTGNDIKDGATKAYFARFQQLLLTDLDEAMLNRLRSLSPTPAPTDPYEPAYGYLKTHLMIASGSCKPDPAFVSRTLKQARGQLSPDVSPEWQELANRQIDFYARALANGNPCPLKEDADARDRARRYLEGIKGIEPIYRGILADADRTLQKPQQLADLASNYKTVLTSKTEISPAFSQQGWPYVQEASKKIGSGAGAESCVLGRGPSPSGLLTDETAAAIQSRFITDYVTQWRDYVAGFSVLPYSNAADAARKLGILADHKSPLLALFALTASQTSFAAPVESGVVAKVKGTINGLIDQGKKKADQVTGAQPDAPHQPSVSDITQTFQPVQWVVPPNSPTWVVEKNAAYIGALSQLGEAMQAIATSTTPDAAVYQAAIGSFDKAMEAAKQIESGFKPLGVQGLDVEVQRLLEEPIRGTTHLIQVDPTQGVANKVNKALAELCGHLRGTLRKYPFQAKGPEETTLPELTAAFSPAGGSIWQFAAGPLAEFAVKDGAVWKSKDPAKKPQVTPELLAFLRTAQSIATGFFAANPSQPGFTYAVRPNLSADFGDSRLQLELDGKSYLWEDGLRKTLPWPGAPGSELRSVARISEKVTHQFDNRKGLWGIFRIMADAEPRPLLGKTVEWRYSIGAEGSKDPITPGPVRIDIVQFPGDTDIFNPSMYLGLSCPNKAVQ